MTTQQMLDERYGRGRTAAGTRRWWLIGGVLIVAALAIVAWMAFASSGRMADADATGYRVLDARSVEVTLRVSAPTGSEVACVLEADDVDHGIVGWKVVTYPASDTHTQHHTETIPTVAEAVNGLVNTCWVP